MSTKTIDFELDLGGIGPFSLVSVHLVEGISELSFATLEIASNEDLDFSTVLTGDAVVTLLVDHFEARRWTLKVGKVAFVGVERGSLRYVVELHPRFWLLRHTTATRKFRNMTGQAIVEKVLSEHAVSNAWSLTRDTEERNYCVQYRETALDFVSRILEYEGVYYTFAEDGKMLLADRSSASPPVDGESYFELIDSRGAMSDGDFGIHELVKGAAVASGAATLNDYNWKTPHDSLLQTKAASENPDLEIYDYPSGYRDPAMGKTLAGLRLEALRVPARFVEGTGTAYSFAPARWFSFGGAVAGGHAGDYLITHVEHRHRNPAFEGGARDGNSYENSFHAIPKSVAFRPRWQRSRPTIAGCHTVMVRGPVGEEIHTDKFGRFKAQFHWDREAKSTDEDSRWVRMLQETATSMTLARVGWEMSVAYVDGDPDRPVGIARNINGVMTPTYGQPSKKTMMTVKTQTYPGGGGFNELRLDDVAGAMTFDVRAERDLVGMVKHDKTEKVGVNESHVVQAAMLHTVERDQNRFVAANDTSQIQGSSQLNVVMDRTMSVGGGESVDVTKSQFLTVDGNDTESVGSLRLTVTGEGSVTRAAEMPMSRTVGGAYIAVAKGVIQHVAGEILTETVGGAKLTVTANGGILQTVSGFLTVNVGGAVIKTAKGDMSVSAHKTRVNVGGSASLKSDIKFEMRSDVIEIEAKSKLTLSSGGLSIEMTPGKTTIVGTMLVKSNTGIRVSGNPDQLTK